MPDKLIKFLFVAGIVLLAVLFDQMSKFWADSNLTVPHFPEHTVDVTVPADAQPMTLSDFVDSAYADETNENRSRMKTAASANGSHIFASDTVNPGTVISFNYVSKTVIDGYFDYQYARNPGAAWSFLADKPESFRTIFFGITGILAIVFILVFIGMHTWKKDRFLIITLACILGGALGNIIDRFRLGYVIDFISWHVAGHYWPTFNVADIFVTCGVALLLIDLAIHRKDADKVGKNDNNKALGEEKDADNADANAEAAQPKTDDIKSTNAG